MRSQIISQAQTKLVGGSLISSSNSEKIRAQKYYAVSTDINKP
jgi:hypothetical protein